MCDIIIEKLGSELNKLGVKRNDMPEKIDISYNSVINYLTGKRVMPLDVFFKILKTYKIDIKNVINNDYSFDGQKNNIVSDPAPVYKNEVEALQRKIFELEIRLDECRRNNEEPIKKECC